MSPPCPCQMNHRPLETFARRLDLFIDALVPSPIGPWGLGLHWPQAQETEFPFWIDGETETEKAQVFGLFSFDTIQEQKWPATEDRQGSKSPSPISVLNRMGRVGDCLHRIKRTETPDWSRPLETKKRLVLRGPLDLGWLFHLKPTVCKCLTA